MTKQTERVRTTISLDPEIHKIFISMAEAGGMSVSRCMGEWLADTAEGAQFVTIKMQEARKAPMAVMREMQSMALGLQDSVGETMANLRAGKPLRSDVRRAPTAKAAKPKAPSSNTGLNSPKTPKK
jgi:hypothetical protein